MRGCKLCGSYAINPHSHGRDPKADVNLCDVCYWRVRAARAQEELEALRASIDGLAQVKIKRGPIAEETGQ